MHSPNGSVPPASTGSPRSTKARHAPYTTPSPMGHRSSFISAELPEDSTRYGRRRQRPWADQLRYAKAAIAVFAGFPRSTDVPFLFGTPHLFTESALIDTGRCVDAERELTSGLQITPIASPEPARRGRCWRAGSGNSGCRGRPVGGREPVGRPGPVVLPGQGGSRPGARMPSWSGHVTPHRGQSPGPPDRPGRLPRPTCRCDPRPPCTGWQEVRPPASFAMP